MTTTTRKRITAALTGASTRAAGAWLYQRQSKRRQDGSEASTEAQHATNAGHAKTLGIPVVGSSTDVGKSGWSPSAKRKGFEEMMTAARNGEFTHLIVLSLSRFSRMGARYAFKIDDELAALGIEIVSVMEHLPARAENALARDLMFTLHCAIANQESELKSEYTSNALAELRTTGGHMSGMPPHGLMCAPERVTVGKLAVKRLIPNPDESPAVRTIFAAVLAGKTARSIAAYLNAEGFVTRKGGRWTPNRVLKLARDPRMAGFSVGPADGERLPILRDELGEPVRFHDGIVSAAEWYEAQAVLDGRTPVRAPRQKRSTLMGSWLLVCGCGSPMTTAEDHHRRASTLVYKCGRKAADAGRGKGHTMVDIATADDFVTRAVWRRLVSLAADPSDPENREVLAEVAQRYAAQTDRSATAVELREVRAALGHADDQLSQMYAERDLWSAEEFRKRVTGLRGTIATCAARVEVLTAALSESVELPGEWFDVDAEADPIGPGTPWHGWDEVERRGFLALFLDRVEAVPSGRGRWSRIEDRLTLNWLEVA